MMAPEAAASPAASAPVARQVTEREARTTPEERGIARDEVRLLVSSQEGHWHVSFTEIPAFLRRGDVLAVNRSATLPAALSAQGGVGAFVLHLCTRYGPTIWLGEPRWSSKEPGPLPLPVGERISVSGMEAVMLGSYPGIPRLRFVAFSEDPASLIAGRGRPIRYGYLAGRPPLEAYQTVFADRPGSAEMPSAARPFSHRTLAALERTGVSVVKLTLHTGVSSLEEGDLEAGDLYPEPFEVTAASAAQLNAASREGHRIIAVGTTVVRALTSAWDGHEFRAARGMTKVFVRPGKPVPPLAGLLTGFHDPRATHLSMLEAVAGKPLVEEGYRQARAGDYLWHEFGDVHLLLPGVQ